jgi:hypothetical protein
MRNLKGFRRGWLALLSVGLLASVAVAVVALLFAEQTPGVPSMFNKKESSFQNQTHFLEFTGKVPGENATTATAYYNAIDPGHKKESFPEWLVNAGFIGDVSQWHTTGPQIIACDLGAANGCDVPTHKPDGSMNYGDNIVNTDSHAIVLNAADLGFVRNQFIRCVPDCKASNPIIYTYLENYPVNPFAASKSGGSGFPFISGIPKQSEVTAAMESALNRPSDDDPANLAFKNCVPANTDTVFKCKTSRIADVAFEWAPPALNPTSSTRFGQLYAYDFHQDPVPPGTPPGTPLPPVYELIAQLGSGGSTPNVATGLLEPFHGSTDAGVTTINAYTGTTADPFPPNLDFIGNKQQPGVCLICHGGKPSKVTTTGTTTTYPNQGNINGFRFLPLDIVNLGFSSETGGEQPATNGSLAYTDRLHQEAQIKEYNIEVLATVPTSKENDGTGSTRQAHLRDVITGWYAGFAGDTNMTGKTQNGFWQATKGRDYIPQGWLEPTEGGTAPPGSENLYQQVLSPNCRSCHFTRETSLDFGTAANFQQDSDLLQLALLPLCKKSNPDPKAKAMPLAHLTFQRYWQTPGAADQIAKYFGYGTVAGYCATNP